MDLRGIRRLRKIITLSHPLVYRYICPAGRLKEPQRIHRGLGDTRITKDRGEGLHSQLRTGEAHQDGRYIVNTWIGINHDPCGPHVREYSSVGDHGNAPVTQMLSCSASGASGFPRVLSRTNIVHTDLLAAHSAAQACAVRHEAQLRRSTLKIAQAYFQLWWCASDT